MSIGLGLFLGLVFCGCVYVYAKKGIVWRWSAIRKVFGMSIGALGVIGLVIVSGYAIYTWYDHRPQIIRSVKGINIGDSIADVKFKVGAVVKNEETTNARRDKYKENNDGYYDVNKNLSLSIVNGIVSNVLYICRNDRLTSIGEIRCGDNGEEILERYGSNNEVMCTEDSVAGLDPDLFRFYRVQKYGVEYGLYQNAVLSFKVFDPANEHSSLKPCASVK